MLFAVTCVLVAVAVLACFAAGAMSFALYGSDPAGNGLAQAWCAFTVLFTWSCVVALLLVVILAAPHPDCPTGLSWGWISIATLVLFVAAAAGQLAGLVFLFQARERSVARLLVQSGVAVVPLAFVLHATWRGLGVPVPAGIATWGCGTLVLLGSLPPFAAWAGLRGRLASDVVPARDRIAYPALLVQGRDAVHVLRSADDLRRVPSALLAPAAPLLIDAGCRAHTLRNVRAIAPALQSKAPDDDVALDFEIETAPEPIDYAAVVALLLAIERLHKEPAEDARIRRLIAMQQDVTGLSFVLPH